MIMTMSQRTRQQVMLDRAVDRSVDMAATLVGLPKATVTTIVEAGVPLMANAADENLQVFTAMYAQSAKPLPEPMRVFYATLTTSPTARQAIVDDFATMFGAQTAAITRETARQAGATDEQVGQVLAATMPAVVTALGKANIDKHALGFGRQLRNVNA
jgi:hypothetical protein